MAVDVAAYAEKGMLSERDLARIAAGEVPSLGKGNVDERRVEEIDEIRLLGIYEKRIDHKKGQENETDCPARLAGD